MRRRLSLTAVLALSSSLLLAPGRVEALINTVDDVPAATLLLPYFEVDLGDREGIDTLFSINNASASAVLAHVVVWSDLSVPVLDFNLYLTGYDVQSINLRDILADGLLPQTASSGQDLLDEISPKGVSSQDINFASCSGQLPTPNLPASFLAHLQTALTGRFSNLLGGCAGLAYSDNIARGYVTVDTVNNCTLRFPGDIGYFAAGGTGDATNQNVLWGDYFYVNARENTSSGETLVHVEASATHPETSVPGEYTFYGRYVGWTAADNREAISDAFAARYLNGGPFAGGTDLLVWRDSKVKQGAFKCGTVPAWYPLGQVSIVIYDEQEHASVPMTIPVSPQPPGQALVPFPAEAQRVTVGGPAFPIPFKFGWIYLNLDTMVTAAGAVPPEDPMLAQAFVSIVLYGGSITPSSLIRASAKIGGKGRFSGGFGSVILGGAGTPQ
jgi:hypothetical protein